MVFAADYPFLDILWTMIIFFCWVVWIWMMIMILTDVFRRHDIVRLGEGRMDRVPDHPAVPGRADLPDRQPRAGWPSATEAGAGPAGAVRRVRALGRHDGGGPRPRSTRPSSSSTAARSARGVRGAEGEGAGLDRRCAVRSMQTTTARIGASSWSARRDLDPRRRRGRGTRRFETSGDLLAVARDLVSSSTTLPLADSRRRPRPRLASTSSKPNPSAFFTVATVLPSRWAALRFAHAELLLDHEQLLAGAGSRPPASRRTRSALPLTLNLPIAAFRLDQEVVRPIDVFAPSCRASKPPPVSPRSRSRRRHAPLGIQRHLRPRSLRHRPDRVVSSSGPPGSSAREAMSRRRGLTTSSEPPGASTRSARPRAGRIRRPGRRRRRRRRTPRRGRSRRSRRRGRAPWTRGRTSRRWSAPRRSGSTPPPRRAPAAARRGSPRSRPGRARGPRASRRRRAARDR